MNLINPNKFSKSSRGNSNLISTYQNLKNEHMNIEFPSKNEYPEYIEMYLTWVKKDGSLLEQLENSLKKTKTLVSKLTDEELNYRYEENKWTIKEVLVHIIDDERIYGYRALSFARNDITELPGFEQEDYVYNSDAQERSINSIMEEYEALRISTIKLFSGFSKKALLREGVANYNKTSVRALGYHILGHELHHVNIIEELYLKEYKRNNGQRRPKLDLS
jgi:uncharacterized damage-inducible protein DinB